MGAEPTKMASHSAMKSDGDMAERLPDARAWSTAPRMKRRDQIALTPDEQRRYLAEEHTVVLSTLDRAGWPHSVAMWYVVDDDGRVVMTTFRKSQKVLNLRR